MQVLLPWYLYSIQVMAPVYSFILLVRQLHKVPSMNVYDFVLNLKKWELQMKGWTSRLLEFWDTIEIDTYDWTLSH